MSGVDASPNEETEDVQEDVFPRYKQKEERRFFLYSDSPSYFGVSNYFFYKMIMQSGFAF